MLLGMINEMPECLEDILEWQAISYQEHFMISGFQDKELAIEAYQHSPEKFKRPFDNCVSKMNKLLLTTRDKVEIAIKANHLEEVTLFVDEYTPKMEVLIKECSSIINGQDITSQQNVIDEYFEDADQNDTDTMNDQNAIDDLFS